MQGLYEELFDAKADALYAYLEQTKIMCTQLKNAQEKSEDIASPASNEQFMSKMQDCIGERTALMNEINRLDVLINEKQEEGYQYSSKESNKKWLCEKLLKDISELDGTYGPTLLAIAQATQLRLKNTNESIKSFRAYRFMDARSPLGREWKK